LSVGEEIKRLKTINSIEPIEKDYIFHKDGCLKSNSNPFEDKKAFHIKGVSSSNSTKYHCKECGKNTNVLPPNGISSKET
jgi:hypothetical protein